MQRYPPLCVPRPHLQPATRTVAGFRFAVLQAALHPRNTLPPPRRSVLRFPASVGHGRGLAARPGCAGPREGIDSARRRLHRFRRVASPRPSRFRFRLAFIHARRTALVRRFLHDPSASTGPASSVADPDHASSFSPPPNCSKKPPPRLIYQSRSRPDRRHASFRQTPRRRISDNAIYV